MTEKGPNLPFEAGSVDHFEFKFRPTNDPARKRPLVGGDTMSTRLASEQVIQTLIDHFRQRPQR